MKKILLLLVTAVLLFGCSKDEEGNLPKEPEVPSTPTGITKESTLSRTISFTREEIDNESILTLKETLTDDPKHPVRKTEIYTFVNNQLTKRNISQEYSLGPNLSSTFELKHMDDAVVITEEETDRFTYTLNAKGYATECIYKEGSQQRYYTFQYSQDNYLTRIEEKISNNLLASLDISYKNGHLASFTTSINGIENTIVCEAGETTNPDKLPCLPLVETYPLSTHIEALYAGILGKSTSHLVSKTQPQNNNDEWTDYRYSTDNSGSITSINMTTHYKGIVYP